MPITTTCWGWVAGVLLGLALQPSAAQQLHNDGFQRRNGQMHIVRNGQARPMTRDAQLPTGVIVTKDGFVVAPGGQRTELREGQGCDLKGHPVAVVQRGAGVAFASAASTPASPLPAKTSAGAISRTYAAPTVRTNKKGKWKKGKGHKKGKGGWGRWKDKDD